jgi:nitric oxide reductase NorQ protein
MNTPSSPSSSTPPTSTPPGTGRLGQGELRRQVAVHLDSHRGTAFTPGEIARALGRSAGAVGNALDVLTDDGHAEQTSHRPRRYRATATTTYATTLAAPRRGHGTARTPAPTPAPSSAPSSGPSFGPSSGSGAAAGGTSSPAGSSPVASEPEAGTGTGSGSGMAGHAGVRRPNGQTYHPRLLAELPDVTALRRLRDAGVPALLYGPPGTGKTSLVEAAFDDLITVAGDGDTATADFVGEYTQTSEGAFEFVYGPLVEAMVEGRALFIDDATLISPKVLAVVYPAMDGRRQITVKAHKGETITAAEGFYVIAGHNPGVHGAVLTDALASRFAAQIQVSTDYDLARTLKIDPRAVKVARNLARRQASGEIGWAPQLRELIAFQKVSGALGRDAAVANLLGIAPDEDRDVVAEVIASVYGRTITPLALGRQL